MIQGGGEYPPSSFKLSKPHDVLVSFTITSVPLTAAPYHKTSPNATGQVESPSTAGPFPTKTSPAPLIPKGT